LAIKAQSRYNIAEIHERHQSLQLLTNIYYSIRRLDDTIYSRS